MKSSPLNYDAHALRSMVGGLSVLDIPRVSVQSREEAYEFLLAYGYDVHKPEELSKLWTYHRKAVTYIQEELLRDGEIIPAKLSDPNELGDIANLLITASMRGGVAQLPDLQSWACGILKVMHVFVHLENDLFSQFSSEIQEQILDPIQRHIHEDSLVGTTLGPSLGIQSIVLKKFEIKSFKTTSSSITKLLAKTELVAFGLLDKIGIRIVTRHLYDVFRVLKYFLDHNIVSFPHNISEQSNNTLYPLNLFIETIESLTHQQDLTGEQIDRMLHEKFESELTRAQFVRKPNSFSDQEFKFMKFITRRLIKLNLPTQDKTQLMTFFYPYEVQIVDYETHLKNVSGPASHENYKARQIERARARVLGLKELH